jgi:hypothetical protein
VTASERRSAAGCLALFAGAIAFAWRPFLTGSRSPFVEDVEFYHHPVTRELVEAWSAGRVPLWTDRIYGGFPFFADAQTAAFYPGTLLVAALGPHVGTVAFLLLHSLLAAVGMWLLVRAHGGGSAGRIAAGLVVPLSGFFAFETKHPGLFAILTWLPVWLVATRAVLLRPTPARIAAAALPLAMMSFAGTLQVMFGVLILYAFYVAGLAFEAVGSAGRRAAGAGIAAVAVSQVLALLLAAVVLLPTFAHFPLTARQLGMTYDFAALGSVHPAQLLGLIARGHEQLAAGGDIDFERASFYAGGLTLPLAVTAVVTLRRRLPAVLAVAAAVLALLAAGRHAPLHPLLYAWQPGAVGALLGMGRAVGPLVVCLALLAGLGLSRVEEPRARRVLVGLLAADLVAHAVLLALAPGGWSLLGSGAVLAAALGCCAALRARPQRLAAALAALVAIDLLGLGAVDGVLERRPPPPGPAQLVGEHLFPALGEIARGRFGGEHERVLLLGFGAANFTFHHRLDGIGGYNPLVTLQYLDFASLANHAALHPREPLVGFVHNIVPGRVHGGLFDAASIRFVISAVPLPWPHVRLLARYGAHPLTGQPVLLYENTRALPRAYLAYRTARVDGPEGLPDRLGPDFDPRRLTVVEGGAAPLAGPDAIEPVQVVRERPERLSFEVAPERPALLVVTDAWHPDWRAWVDGDEVAVLRVNAHFRGVVLPAGARRVEMRFEPWTWRAGSLVSAATFALLALVAGVSRALRPGRQI